MRYLLDTHALLWFSSGSPELSAHARSIIEDPAHEICLSIASTWEMAIKVSLGKLELAVPIEHFLDQELSENGWTLLNIQLDHVVRVASMPFHHRDPFDRMLAAQCLVEDLSLISRDELFDAYEVKRAW